MFLEENFAQRIDIRSIISNALQALQHRGEEGAGIAVSTGSEIAVVKGVGRVETAFRNNEKLRRLPQGAQVAIGHVRYSTTENKDEGEAGRKARVNPIFRSGQHGDFALGHNGQVNFTRELREEYGLDPSAEISDTNTVADIVQIEYDRTGDFEEAVRTVCRKLSGAFSFTFMTKDKIIGVCDRNGLRPLELARVAGGNGWVLSSETCALNMADAQFVRSIVPGEMITIDKHGIRSEDIFPPEEVSPRRCLLEAFYFSRPDSTTDYFPEGESGIRVRRSFQDIRHKLGAALAEQWPADADFVIGVPESGKPAAEGYAEQSGLPLKTGIIKNSFVGRSFTAPSQAMRVSKVALKLNPIGDRLYNQRVVVVDDTIVRATTLKRLTIQLREAGVRQVHYRIPAPPLVEPCFYGIDLPTYEELIAARGNIEFIRQYIGADSLAFLDLSAAHAAVAGNIAVQRYCDACMTGAYPTPVPIEVRKKPAGS